MSETSRAHALTLLLVNPEPLIFSAFPEEEGFPFARYLGACGRAAVFRHEGPMLGEFHSARWEKRVQLARQILQAAFLLTRNRHSFALYLTDWSADNFAVGPSDGRLRLVDGEGFVVVDQARLAEFRAPGWDEPHTTRACPDNFCFAPAELCNRKESDHNLYGACKGLLAPGAYHVPGGLLHSVPAEARRRHPLLERLLLECAEPTHPGGRFEAAQELLEILKQL